MKNRSLWLLTIILAFSMTACGALAPAQTPVAPTITPQIAPSQTAAPQPSTPVEQASPTAPVSVNHLPPVGEFHWIPVHTGFDQPLDIQFAPDDNTRLFVVERAGVIHVLVAGDVLPTPFLNIRKRVGDNGSERGLLGLAFHPDHAHNGHLFVNYTNRDGDTVIARFTVSADANQVDENSETKLMTIAQPYANHNGGGLAFGPDGYLYIALGDGGSGGDPLKAGQSLDTLLGKILRIDVNNGQPYTIPADNPFVNGGGLPEIWAYGLRNPWRFSFDRLTGDVHIADVGQNKWEEVNFILFGAAPPFNFGWNIFEASEIFEGQPVADLVYLPPIAEYGHELGCSVTGGVVYRGSMPEWQGVYLFGDFCSGRIWGTIPVDNGWQTEILYETGAFISTFGVDQQGEVYFADYRQGVVYQLQRR